MLTLTMDIVPMFNVSDENDIDYYRGYMNSIDHLVFDRRSMCMGLRDFVNYLAEITDQKDYSEGHNTADGEHTYNLIYDEVTNKWYTLDLQIGQCEDEIGTTLDNTMLWKKYNELRYWEMVSGPLSDAYYSYVLDLEDEEEALSFEEWKEQIYSKNN